MMFHKHVEDDSSIAQFVMWTTRLWSLQYLMLFFVICYFLLTPLIQLLLHHWHERLPPQRRQSTLLTRQRTITALRPRRTLGFSLSFERSIKETYLAVVADRAPGSVRSTDVRLPLSPASYVCEFVQHQITDRKTNETYVKGYSTCSHVQLHFSPRQIADGLLVRGHRKVRENGSVHAITEGVVAPNGRAYWVERGKFRSILVTGQFTKDSFHGEWLSADGLRGRLHLHLEGAQLSHPVCEKQLTRSSGLTAPLLFDIV